MNSPLVDNGRAFYESEIPVDFLIQSYRKNLNIDVKSYFKHIDSVKIFKCESSGYRFYYPLNLGGKKSLYEELQKFEWYYMPWKWEYKVCSELISDHQSVLEIGCGKGYFLRHISTIKRVRCIGLELNRDVIYNTEKIKILNVPLRDFSETNKEIFDVVCSFQVLEHISNVKEFIENQIYCLKKGGILIISVPNNDSFIRHDNNFILNMPPHHMGLWSETSLKSLERIFKIKLKRILFEPIQPYHFEYYYRTILRAKKGMIVYKLLRILYKMGMKKRILKRIEEKADQIKGHTIVAVYEK